MSKRMKALEISALVAVFIVLPLFFVGLHALTGQEVDPMNSFLEDVFIPQPWRYNVPDGEVRRSLIVSYVGPESAVESDMQETRLTMREIPWAFCAGDFQPGLIRELNGPTGDFEIVCVHNWDIKTGGVKP